MTSPDNDEFIFDSLRQIEDWEDRYRYLIELGRELPSLPERDKTEDNRVLGCASRVWLLMSFDTPLDPLAERRLVFHADSDAFIVRGLIKLVLALYSHKTAQEILKIDAIALFDSLGLSQHLSSQRSNGLRSLIATIRAHASAVMLPREEYHREA